MVLNPHGIEPNFLKLDSLSLGAGTIFIITYNVLNSIKKEKKNQFYTYKKHLTLFLKIGSIPCWVQFHAYTYYIIIVPMYFFS